MAATLQQSTIGAEPWISMRAFLPLAALNSFKYRQCLSYPTPIPYLNTEEHSHAHTDTHSHTLIILLTSPSFQQNFRPQKSHVSFFAKIFRKTIRQRRKMLFCTVARDLQGSRFLHNCIKPKPGQSLVGADGDAENRSWTLRLQSVKLHWTSLTAKNEESKG